MNEITGITETVGTAWVDPVHDKAGNMTTLPKPSSLSTALTCKWDAWNRLRTAQGCSVARAKRVLTETIRTLTEGSAP